MKILLIQTPLASKEYPVYPLGLAYIGTALSAKGHTVTICDPNTASNPWLVIKHKIKTDKPEIIGISLRNLDNQHRIDLQYYYKNFRRTLQKLTTIKGAALIIVGGAGFSMFAEKIMNDNPELDFGVYLEGEDSFPELLENLTNPSQVKGIFFRYQGETVFSGKRTPPDFAKIATPQRNFLEITPYLHHENSVGVQTKRGCPLSCSYCNYPFLNGNKWRFRDPSRVVDEIEELVKFKIINIVFADSVFNIPYDYSTAILKEIVKRQLPIKWNCYMHAKGISKEYLFLAKDAGCRKIIFSPDALSASALRGLQKNIDRSDINNIIQIFTEEPSLLGLEIAFCLFLNPPGENISGLLQTLLFFMRSKLSRKWRYGANVNWIRIEPYTKVYEQAKAEGLIRNSAELLPETTQALKKTFYSQADLKWLDRLLMMFLKILNKGKSTFIFLKNIR